MKPLGLILLGASALLLSAAAAQAAPEPLQSMRMLADENNDGKVTPEEYQKSRRDFIMKADTNKDGKVSRAEWDKAAVMERNQAQRDGVPGADKVGYGGWFEMIDHNKDGVITPAEIDATMAERFKKLDLNHDGVVDRVEGRRLRQSAQMQIRH